LSARPATLPPGNKSEIWKCSTKSGIYRAIIVGISTILRRLSIEAVPVEHIIIIINFLISHIEIEYGQPHHTLIHNYLYASTMKTLFSMSPFEARAALSQCSHTGL
jgi:hypothetical protein